MPGSDVHHILVRIARMYYDQELTQLDISRRLRISRQKVQRMLVRAKQEGIVRISIVVIRTVIRLWRKAWNRNMG